MSTQITTQLPVHYGDPRGTFGSLKEISGSNKIAEVGMPSGRTTTLRVDDRTKLMEEYQPKRVADLVAKTPADDLFSTLVDLHRVGSYVNGKYLLPNPPEIEWINGVQLNAASAYNLIRQVVQIELQRFAERLERYYDIVPKVRDESSQTPASE